MFKKRILGALFALALIPSMAFATADTLRVIRSGVLVQTPSPIVTNLTIEGTYTGPSFVSTTNNFAVTKATPVISAVSNTNTAASMVVDGGTSTDASIIFKSNAVSKWAVGNDSSATNGFAISTGGALGTTDRLQITAAGATTITGALTVTGAQTFTGASTHSAATTFSSATVFTPITLAASATTLNAALGNVFFTQANGGATALATINNPTAGQVIRIIGGSATNATTIADSGNFKLTAAMTLGLNDSITLLIYDATTWVELSRADN